MWQSGPSGQPQDVPHPAQSDNTQGYINNNTACMVTTTTVHGCNADCTACSNKRHVMYNCRPQDLSAPIRRHDAHSPRCVSERCSPPGKESVDVWRPDAQTELQTRLTRRWMQKIVLLATGTCTRWGPAQVEPVCNPPSEICTEREHRGSGARLASTALQHKKTTAPCTHDIEQIGV
jgi:hypothetical protein